jgi:hypothetical protein
MTADRRHCVDLFDVLRAVPARRHRSGAHPLARHRKLNTAVAAGQREPPAVPPNGIARPEPARTIPIGLDRFCDWYGPHGLRYQDGFSTVRPR